MKKIIKRILAVTLSAAILVQPLETNVVNAQNNSATTNSEVFVGDGFTVTYTLSSSWVGGYNSTIRITNTGDQPIFNWYLKTDNDEAVSSIWNASLVNSEDGSNIYKAPEWKQNIGIGESVVFGINVGESFEDYPSSYELVNQPVLVQDTDYTINYKIDCDWGSGYIASLSITNNSEYTFEDWMLQFDYDNTISSIWNAALEYNEDGEVTITNTDGCHNIEPGQTVNVGFVGSGSGDKTPSDYMLIQFTQYIEEEHVDDGDDESYSYDELATMSDEELDEYLSLDTDGDGLLDIYEENLGTDKTKADTDGDGLSDYDEAALLGTDPTLKDTDGDGIEDSDSDSDQDGISNKKELELGTDLGNDDTDKDDLKDGDEINLGTDPCLEDTDGDGVSDGEEVKLGTDPLTVQEEFNVTREADEEDTVNVSVDIDLSGEQVDTLTVEKVDDEFLFPDTMPGYIGGAYEFTVDGSFDEATLNFEFDSELLEDPNFDPVIYYYNEKDQVLEELETTISGNVASATTTHFSTYILLNRNKFGASFEYNDVVDDNSYSRVQIVFVIDDSGSMNSNDSQNTRLTVAKDLLNNLPEDSKVGLVKFASDVTVYTNTLTENIDNVKSYLSSNYFSRYGNTALCSAVNKALSLYEEDDEALKVMVLLTDGSPSDSSKYAGVKASAQVAGVKIYSIGLGANITSAVNNYLKPLSELTGGLVYKADNASELSSIFNDIHKKLDLVTDSDGDGIADFFEDHLTMFNGTTLTLDKNNDDTDGDGLKDGEEVTKLNYKFNEDKTKFTVTGYLKSNPLIADTDYDGIDDALDYNRNDNTYYGTLDTDYKGKGNYKFNVVNFNMDYRWFFGDNKSYNPSLATASLIYSAVAYHTNNINISPKKVTLKVTKNTDRSGYTTVTRSVSGGNLLSSDLLANGMMDYFGMTNTEDIKLTKNIYKDQHLSEVYLGYKKVEFNNQSKIIVPIVVRGTALSSQDEWTSNFDVGDYSNKDKEWSNTENHMGFDITAKRIESKIDNYLKRHNLNAADCVFWITGHSRGAAIANIIGADYEKKGRVSFTYTFAAPNTTVATDATTNYTTIYNIVNKDDFVPKLPMDNWNYKRYGKTCQQSIDKKYYSDWTELTGYNYRSCEDWYLDLTITAMSNIIYGDNINTEGYTYTCSDHGNNSHNDMTAFNHTLTKLGVKLLENMIPSNAKKYCKVTSKSVIKYINMRLFGRKVKIPVYLGEDYTNCQTPAFFMQYLADIMGGGAGTAIKNVLLCPLAPRYALSMTFISIGYLCGIEHPHYVESYYVLSKNIKAADFK